MAKGRSARKEKKKPKKKKEKSTNITWSEGSKDLDGAQKQWIKRWK